METIKVISGAATLGTFTGVLALMIVFSPGAGGASSFAIPGALLFGLGFVGSAIVFAGTLIVEQIGKK